MGFYCLLLVMGGKLFPVVSFETREAFEASHFFGTLLKIYIENTKLCLPDALKYRGFF